MRKIKIKPRRINPTSKYDSALYGEVTPDMVDSDDENIRAIAALKGYALEKLVHDTSPKVRKNVAINMYGLDILVNDTDCDVAETAKRKMEQLNNDRL